MESVFQSICAEISSEFETLLSDNNAMNFMEKVCDLTGTLMVTNPNSLKICGSWSSILQTHNILSAFTVMKTLMQPEVVDNENNMFENFKNEKYVPSPKRKRGRPTKVINFMTHFSDRVAVEQSLNKLPIMQTSTCSVLPEETSPEKDCDNATRVPVLLTSSPDNASHPVPVMLSSVVKNEPTKNNSPIADKGYESNMYVYDTSEDLASETPQTSDQSFFMEDNDVYSCTMCKYKTTNARNLESHLDRFHFKPVTCHICGRGFGYERDLKRHLLKNKYSCGTRRSIINDNYVTVNLGTDIDTDEQMKIDMTGHSENSESDIGQLPIYQSKENDEINSKKEIEKDQIYSTRFKVKEEPIYVEDMSSEPNFGQGLQVSSSLLQEKRSSLKGDGAIKLNIAKRKFDGERSLEEMSQSLDEQRESDDPYQITWNRTVYETNESEECAQSNRINNTNQRSNLSIINENEKNYLSNLGYVICDDDFIVEPNSSAFSCKHCTYIAYKKQHVVSHICRMHKKQFSCDHCNSMFGLIKDLNRHLRRSHGIDIPLKNSRGMVIERLEPLL